MSYQPKTKETNMERSATLPAGKKAGIGMHFASLAGPHGIGDIGDSARAFVDTLAHMRLAVWQFLPTGPTAYGDSPYQPLSAFAGNEMLIGINPLVRMGLLTRAEAEALEGLSSESVDYGKLFRKSTRFWQRLQSAFHQTQVQFLNLHMMIFCNSTIVIG